MAYIGKSIESGTFSVLDTSGNTYNGSNTAFNLGTQVGSVAQLLVSHDGVIQKPGTDYTLSSGGAAITFTTAPASGASIFIVEISGAVGGPLDSDLNGTELILDADGDTSITADTDDQIDIKIANSDSLRIKANEIENVSGDLTLDVAGDIILDAAGEQIRFHDAGTLKGFISMASDNITLKSETSDKDILFQGNDGGAGITALTLDMSEAGKAAFNAGITATTVVGSSAAQFATLGVINAKDLGTGIHIKTADSGASVSSEADELVIEHGNAIGGMTFLAATNGLTKIAFGDSGNNDAGIISYSHDNTTMAFTVEGTERMSILGDGAVKVNTSFFIETERDDSQKINVEFGGDNEGGILLNDKDAANNGTFVQFKRSNTQIGTIRRNGTNDAVSYNTSSDYRLKDGIVNLTGGIDTIKKLKPRKFYWKSDTDKTLIDGFIAHEVQDVAELSHSVTGTKDATRQITDGDGVTTTEMDTQGLDYSKLVTYLTVALQESITKIESLEARVTTLEG